MNTLNAGGAIFMAVAWTFIIALNVFCIWRLLRKKPANAASAQNNAMDSDKTGQ